MDPRRHAWEHLAGHLHAGRDWDRLFELVDKKGFLAEQAKTFSSFERSNADLERYVLPGTLERKDWDRFIHYALLAVNLRGLAEALADEEILGSLARQGQVQLAGGLAAQLGDRLRNAWARSVLAASVGDGERADLIRAVHDDLESLDGPLDVSLLQSIARHIGPDIQDLWLKRLSRWASTSKDRDEIRWTLAEAWARKGDLQSPGFHESLIAIENPAIRGERLPGLWLRRGPDDLTAARHLASAVGDPDGRQFWSLAVLILGRLATAAADSTWTEQAWARQVEMGPPVPWSPALVEQGRDLFGHFSTAGADRLTAELSDPVHRAAFRVLRLEQQADSERAHEAFRAVEALARPEIKLHHALRIALAWPKEDAEERRRLASILTDHLHRRRYVAPASDLARFLDLVAATYPEALRAQTDNVAWSPEMKPGSLLTLAESVTQPDVLAGLIQKAESYAAVVGATEAEGFELRTRLLIRAASRLCRLLGAWDEEVVKKLLPEEEDELREAAARELAALGKSDDAWSVTEKIRSPRRKLIVQLSIAPERASFDPENLYEAVANVDAAEDERLALEMLAEPPLDPEALIKRYLTPMRSRGRQVQALIDLAHRAQALEELHREGQKDPMAPLQLVRSSLTAVGSDEHLLGLTLELVELAAPLQRARALAEVHEAAEVILLRLDVPWELRRSAFETLLSRLGPILLERPMRNREFMARCGAVAGLINLIVDLPDKAEESEARAALRAHWHEVFPVILAAAARLNGLVAAHLAHPIRARIWGHWLPEISRLVGWERSWQILGRLEGRLPRSWRERLRTRWNGMKFESFAASWSWLNDKQKEILRLCLGDPRELPSRITGSAAERGLIFRLAAADPRRAPKVLRRFPERERSRLGLCLLRDGWVPADTYSELLSTIDDPALQLEAEARQEGKGWLRALSDRLALHGLDPSGPAAWSLLRRLREEAQPEDLPILADAVLGSMAQGGERGQAAFRVWLNSFLAPGVEEGGEAHDRAGRVQEALQRALRLGPSPREFRKKPEPESSSEPEADPSSRAGRLWAQAWRRSPRSSWWEVGPTFGNVGRLAAFFSSFLLIPIDACLLGDPQARPVVLSTLPWWIVTLALLLLCNAILLDCVLARRREDDASLPGWARALRLLASGLPVLGLYSLPVWPHLFPQSSPYPGDLRLETVPKAKTSRLPLSFWPREPLQRLVVRDWSLQVYLVGNMALLFGVILALFFAGLATPWLLVPLSFFCHLSAAEGLMAYVATETQWLKAAGVPPPMLLLPASLTLFPIPFVPFLGFVLFVLISPALTRESRLSTPWWRSTRRTWIRERSDAERRLLWLYASKSSTLFFDTAALSWLFSAALNRFPGAYTVIRMIITGLAGLTFLIGATGLGLMIARFPRRFSARGDRQGSADRHPFDRYLAMSQIAFAAGLLSGEPLWNGNGREIGALLAVPSICGAAICFLRIFESPPHSGRRSSQVAGLGCALFTWIGLTCHEMARNDPEGLVWLMRVCTAFFVLTMPLFAMRQLLAALLRPFHIRDIRDHGWPRPLRRAVLFLTVTALLPLGGLAVPAWIWIRYRYWPNFEGEWQGRVSRSHGAGSPARTVSRSCSASWFSPSQRHHPGRNG